MSRQQLKKYIWLIDTIRSAGERGITYEEINERWKDADKNHFSDRRKPLPWRTYQDDREAIEEIFGIVITCNRRDYTYRIGEPVTEWGSVRGTLVDALVLNNAVRETPDLNNSIVFSRNFQQKSMPQLVKAIREHRAVRFRYERHSYAPEAGIAIDRSHLVTFQPYGLYHSALWFAVGRTESGRIRVFALHRIFDIEILEDTFTIPEDFNVRQFMTGFRVSDDDLGPDRETDDGFALESFEADQTMDLNL